MIPEIALTLASRLPKIDSAVTAVSASKGVGEGRIKPSAAEATVALTCVVSSSTTVISMYA